MMKAVLTSAVIMVVLACATPAHAELVFFATGRTMSVKSHRADGDSLVLLLRSGGEIVCDASTVAPSAHAAIAVSSFGSPSASRPGAFMVGWVAVLDRTLVDVVIP